MKDARETRDALVTIGLVADLHYAPGSVGNRYCSDSLLKLEQAVTTFEARQPDLVINLGDSIDASPTVAEELDRLREIKRTLARLPVETHFLLGNHDVSELTREQFLEVCGARGSRSYYSFDCRGVHIVMLDSNYNSDGNPFAPGNFRWDDAWVGTEQIEWLREDLAAAADRTALVFCHANLDHRVRADGRLNGHIVKDAVAVRRVLESSGAVKAVVQGHDHAGNQAAINGIPYIGLQAMTEGPGLDHNAYALLTLLRDGAIVLEGFGRQPSFRMGEGEVSNG